MLFLQSGNSKLIDFDLADKENTKYPDYYNEFCEGHHRDAQPNKDRKLIQDRFSFFWVMRQCSVLTEVQLDDFLKSNNTLESFCK